MGRSYFVMVVFRVDGVKEGVERVVSFFYKDVE